MLTNEPYCKVLPKQKLLKSFLLYCDIYLSETASLELTGLFG